MAISIKSQSQIAYMREVGHITAKLHILLESKIKPGITTKELDEIAEDFIRSNGAVPSFKGIDGFPGTICASINEEVIHGIPSSRKLKDGDIISIDTGAYKDGFHSDAARTIAVGSISEDAKKLIDVTRQSFFEGIKYAREGMHLHQISAAIGDYAESLGYGVVKEYVGHGVGRKLHEEPQIPNYRVPTRGPKLYKGMVLAIEPMINQGTCKIKVLKDGWTVVTLDKKLSAHYENTVLITDGDPELLTLES